MANYSHNYLCNFKVAKVEKGKYWIFTEMFVSQEDTLRWNNWGVNGEDRTIIPKVWEAFEVDLNLKKLGGSAVW